jgi:cytidylate kinase
MEYPVGAVLGFSITVSRQMGSLGEEVARLTADRLGYRFMWREVINSAARQAGAPEAALAAIDELGLLSICPSPEDCLAYRQAIQRIMEELASPGKVVILGRAGQFILRDHPRVLHVRMIAPTQVRIERLAARQKIPVTCAQEQIIASDRYRRSYLKRFYSVQVDDPTLYDLVINTARLDAPAAADLIVHALALRMQATPEPEGTN